jgi:serine protease Do
MAVHVHLWQSSVRMSAFCGLFVVGLLLLAGTAGAQPEPEPPAALASVEELAKRVRPSVVVVMFEGREGRQEGLGTGFVIDADGLIATNLHVAGEARPLAVQLADGSRHAVTEVTASDRAMDLAILRIKPPAEALVPLPLGDSDNLPDGLPVITVGNPHGLAFSVVNGVVSGVREVDDRRMIQLAMPIEPGNSGGPVVDPAGRVVGIVTIKSLVTRNLGFAVGVNALKPLLEKPNPVPMSRWLTIGTLDATQWTTLFGGRWQQRGGRIVVTEAGSGFGGRSLCLSRREVPAPPFELSVHVKLGDESGAAGLAFHADGGNRHYGFYPTAGKLRVTRFDGPSVFEWKVLRDMPSPHYRPGDWNRLTVRVEKEGFRCLINGEPFATVDDDSLPPGRVGLAKFRDTDAEFKLFRVGPPADATQPDAAIAARLEAAIDQLPPLERLTPAGIAPLVDDAEPAATAVRDRATTLEKRAADLRLVAADLHTARVSGELARLCAQGDDCDLLRAALIVAQLDDEELDIDAYVQQVDRMAQEIAQSLPKDADEPARLAALNKYLFADNGFHGSRTDYYHRANSHLSRVIDDREGLPITLSILYMELAKRLDMNVVGIGLPGHFVVKHIPRQGDEQLIDVFEGAVPMSREDAAKRVRAMADEELGDDHLRPFSKPQIVRRVLRNLLGVAQDAKDREAMLRSLEALVAIQPDDTADRGLLAVARFETGRREAAITGLDWFLEQQPSGIDLDVIRTLQDRFRNGTPPQ